MKTPHSFPYLTANPEVTIIDRDNEQDDFLIIASDGLWDEYSGQEACQIVAKYLSQGLSLSDCAAR